MIGSGGHAGEDLLVKICGFREPAHAVVAAEQGADLIGFIFAPSRRQVDAATARRCIEAAKSVSPRVRAVGVFVDADVAEMNAAVRDAGLDVLQLHGSEHLGVTEALDVPVIRVIRPRPAQSVSEVLAGVQPWVADSRPPAMLMVDTYSAAAAGGTGEVTDWTVARAVAFRWPTLLAGGLTAGNVADAVAAVRPAGVDVSSGVERDGVKDPALIARFIAAARAAAG